MSDAVAFGRLLAERRKLMKNDDAQQSDRRIERCPEPQTQRYGIFHCVPTCSQSSADTSLRLNLGRYRTFELPIQINDVEFRERGLLFLFQQKHGFFANKRLQRFSKFCQKPRQKHFELYAILGNIDRAADGLAERAHPKLQMIAGPNLFFDAEQMPKAGAGAAEPFLQAAKRLLLAEAMRNGDDKRLCHG